MLLMIGALLGLLSVMCGAYAEHGLHSTVSEAQFHLLMTAVRYHQIHAVMISSIGIGLLVADSQIKLTCLKWGGWLLIVGTMLFSLSIYASVVLNMPSLTKVTPSGGMIMMFAWLLLAYAGLTSYIKSRNKVQK